MKRHFMVSLCLLCLVGDFLIAQSGDEHLQKLRQSLGLDQPPPWAYVLPAGDTNDFFVLDYPQDAEEQLIAYLELNSDQVESLRQLVDNYRQSKTQWMVTLAEHLEFERQYQTEDTPDDPTQEAILSSRMPLVETFSQTRETINTAFFELLTPQQIQRVLDLDQSTPHYHEIESEYLAAEDDDSEANKLIFVYCASFCTDKVMIIGCDDRKKFTSCTKNVKPWQYVGHFSNGCSGTLIGPRHVLSAAHCFYSNGSFSSGTLGFSLGRFGNGWKPYGTQYVERIAIPGEYGTQNSVQKNKAFDYALVELWHAPVGAEPMDFGYESWSNLKNATSFSIGYPGTTNFTSEGQVVETGSGSFLNSYPYNYMNGGDNGLLYITNDAEGGQSGSPVYRFNNSGRKVVGVLIGSPPNDCKAGRIWAARITPGAEDRLNTWKNWFWSNTYSIKRGFYTFKTPDAAYAPTCP